MPRKTQRRKQLEANIRRARFHQEQQEIQNAEKNIVTRMNCRQFAYSVIISGLSYNKVSMCFLQNNIVPPGKSVYYKNLKDIIDAIATLAREQVNIEQQKMVPGTVISFDGSWDHRRHGKCCIVVAIDQIRKKIIDFEIIQKSSKLFPTDYHGSPQGMETEAVKRISLRLKNDRRIVGYVHDRDSSVASYMRNHWPITEYLDRNHSIKTLATKFKIVENVCGKQDQLFTHLHNFMNYLI